jgi:ankyrin repeat protein
MNKIGTDNIAAIALKAAKYGDLKTIKSLISKGGDFSFPRAFDAALTDFRTVARKQDHLEVLKVIYDKGLDYDTRIGWMNQPLVCECAMYGNAEIIKYAIYEKRVTNLFCNISIGNLDAVKKTIKSNSKLLAQSDENGFNGLHYCASSALGKSDPLVKERLHSILRLLIEAGADPCLAVKNQLNLNPLLLCAWFGGDADILRILVRAGAKPDGDDNKALEFALEPHQRSGEPYYHIADTLLKLGADLNRKTTIMGRTVLHGASHRGSILPVRWLIDHNANVNALTDDGKTPLHLAADRNTGSEVVRMLVESGCDWNAKDRDGKTAIQYAISKKRTKVIAFLKSL